MIKNRYFMFIVCLLFSSISYSQTEIKPPDGPFNSMLRATYQLDPLTLIANDPDKKKYNFKVPDLGRYQERSPSSQLEVPKNIFIDKMMKPIDNAVWNDVKQKNNDKTIYFDPYAFVDKPAGVSQNGTPFSDRTIEQNNTPQRAMNKSFDSMPIGFGSSNDVNSYPPEWTNSMPLNPSPNFQNQRQTMMRRPFPVPSKMPVWPLNNNLNSGYQ